MSTNFKTFAKVARLLFFSLLFFSTLFGSVYLVSYEAVIKNMTLAYEKFRWTKAMVSTQQLSKIKSQHFLNVFGSEKEFLKAAQWDILNFLLNQKAVVQAKTLLNINRQKDRVELKISPVPLLVDFKEPYISIHLLRQ